MHPFFNYPISSHYAKAYLPPTPPPPPPVPSSWSKSGPHKCTYRQCSFTGSQKSVEIHMMDRHLIYPPNTKKTKNTADDWDADPSLKGKPIPIQGTNIILKTQEDIDAWTAERKKFFPTTQRVADKKEKLKEAIARGQLHLEDNPRFPKRPRLDPYASSRNVSESGRGRGTGRGAPRGKSLRQNFTLPLRPPASLPPRPSLRVPSPQSDDDDEPPETMSSKPTELFAATNSEQTIISAPERPAQQPPLPFFTIKKPIVRQPKNLPLNPFAPKQSLLRNLLLPEIRNTVSNLSQAIRFLVDNDFLENVELKPGDAAQQKIQVVTQEEQATVNLLTQSSTDQ